MSPTDRGPTLALALCALALSAPALPARDLDRGQQIFEKKCATCHEIGGGADHGIGPALRAIYGAEPASAPGFAYSANLRQLARDGMLWDAATLSAYIRQPKSIVPSGKKSIFGVRDEADLSALIAFLHTLE